MLDRKPLYYIFAILLLAALIPLQGNIDKRRLEEKLVVSDRPAIRPGEAAVGLLLAGFRGVAANMLWFRAMVLFEQQRVTEEIPLFQAISYLQPRFRATWSFGGWHMAYNVSAHFYDREDLTDEQVDDYRYQCFKIGEEFLRKGIEHNYYHYDLHWDLGFSVLYYKEYRLLKEKGWAGEQEALQAALDEMNIAALFQPPLAWHPAYVDRIIAIIMREGGMLEEAYKRWHRLAHLPPDENRIIEIIMREGGMGREEAYKARASQKNWSQENQDMHMVKKHMDRVVERIAVEETRSYAMDLEKEKNFTEAYSVWYKLLIDSREKQKQLAADKLADADSVMQAEKDVQAFSENVAKLGEVLKNQGVDLEALERGSLKEGAVPALRERIERRFASLQQDAEKDREADMAKTMRMYRELTKPAPKLDWWVLLLVPLLLLAVGFLISGKEAYAS